MIRRILAQILLLSITCSANAGVLYEFDGTFSRYGLTYGWKFVASGIINSSTTIDDVDLLSSYAGSGAVSQVTLFDGLTPNPIGTFFSGVFNPETGAMLTAVYPFYAGPLTSYGSYTFGMTATTGTLRISEYVVPEPGTLALLGLGLTGLAALRRRRIH